MSLTEIREVPKESLVLLAGPPGAGKSALCCDAVVSGIAAERPIIFVTTERTPFRIIEILREKGVGQPAGLSFVDAFTETVGMVCRSTPGTLCADCSDLNTLSIAVTRLQEGVGKKDILLVLDSLTSPYLLAGVEVVKFMRLFLSKFVAEGNSVLTLMDEGCGKEEDMVALMSIADGVLRMVTQHGSRIVDVVKHPKLKPTRIETSLEPEPTGLEERIFNPEMLAAYIRGDEAVMRREVGDFVSLFWPNFAHWSGMLWDPKRFPMMVYEMNKEDGPSMFKLSKVDETVKRAFLPRRIRLLMKLFMPKNFSKVEDMKKLVKGLEKSFGSPKQERSGILEYLEDASKTDEHYFRMYESSECWGFKDVGATMAFYLPPGLAGMMEGLESWRGREREWNCVETKCIGLGDPYCEGKLLPGGTDELKASLEKDILVIERTHERLMHHLMDFLLHGKPLLERPTLGSMVNVHRVCHAMVFPALAGERYRMVLGMGGARAGKQVGERLLEARLSEDEAVKRILNFLNQYKVGKATVNETIRIVENCESSQTKLFTTKEKVPSCYFTTGFLNGFFSTVKNQHVKETKCIAKGDPYCEWEFK